MSFESVDYPNFFLRHKGFECFFEDKNNPRSNDSFLADATFRPSSNAYFTVSDAYSVHQPH